MSDGFLMPAEWERHEATWIGWPHNATDWPGKFPAIPLVYVVGKRLVGSRPAVFATAVGAASPFWVWHSDEARMYPLLLCLTLASLALLFKAVEEGGAWRWTAYAVVTALSLYSHYFALLMLPVHLAYLLIHRVPWRKLLAWGTAMAGVAAMFAPWIIALYINRISRPGGGFASLANSVRLESPSSVTGVVYEIETNPFRDVSEPGRINGFVG